MSTFYATGYNDHRLGIYSPPDNPPGTDITVFAQEYDQGWREADAEDEPETEADWNL
jgi:hypothetical protein